MIRIAKPVGELAAGGGPAGLGESLAWRAEPCAQDSAIRDQLFRSSENVVVTKIEMITMAYVPSNGGYACVGQSFAQITVSAEEFNEHLSTP